MEHEGQDPPPALPPPPRTSDAIFRESQDLLVQIRRSVAWTTLRANIKLLYQNDKPKYFTVKNEFHQMGRAFFREIAEEVAAEAEMIQVPRAQYNALVGRGTAAQGVRGRGRGRGRFRPYP